MKREHWDGAATCQATGKRTYVDRKTARRVKARIHDSELRVYHCDDCDGYHLGHQHKVASRELHRSLSHGIEPTTALRVRDAANRLGVSAETLDALILAGYVKAAGGYIDLATVAELEERMREDRL